MTSIISDFQAIPRDQSVILNWTYAAEQFIKVRYLCVNYSDTDIQNLDVQTSSQKIIPIRDEDDNAITYYTLTGLTNGKEYILSLEVTTMINTVENTSSVKITTAAPPSKPNFSLVQSGKGKIRINLLDSNGNTPKPMTTFDAYSPLTGAYVTYNNGKEILSKFFTNDNNNDNSLYTRNLEIIDLSLGVYEVNVKTSNVQGISLLSDRKAINILNIPDAPSQFTATPTMLIDPSFNFSNVSMSLSWSKPVFIGDPSLNKYKLYRNNELISTIETLDNSGHVVRNYLDNVGLVAGNSYTYKVESINSIVSNDNPALYNTVDVSALDIPSIISVTRTSKYSAFDLDISYNANGFLSSEIQFDLSGNNNITSSNFTQNPLTVNGLINGTKYNYQVRVKGTRNKTFTSSYTAVARSMPYAPLEPVNTLQASAVDASLNPLDGKIKLMWVDPSNALYRPSDYTIKIFQKFNSSPDASYVMLADIAKEIQQYTVENLTNGTSYKFKAVKSQLLEETNTYITSSDVSGERTPFTLPSPIADLSFNDISMNVAFRKTSTGGLPLKHYELSLYNVSNGNSVLVNRLNENKQDVSGIVYFDLSGNGYADQPGRKYKLDVRQVVASYNVDYFGSIVSKTAYSKPTPLAAPTVANVDASDNPLDGKLLVKWVLTDGFDASNVAYDLYVAGAPNPIVGASNLSTPCFMHTGLTNGASFRYEVVVKIGGISSDRSAASTAISPFRFPAVVTGLISTVTTATTATLSWTAANVSLSGVIQADVRYKIFDASSNIVQTDVTDNSLELSGLTAGVDKVYNVIVGVAKNSTTYYRSDFTTVDVATYGPVNAPVGVQIFPSDSTILVDLTDAAVVSGLDFSNYRYNYKLSSSSTWSVNSDQTKSLFYINNLTNGLSYDVKVALLYKSKNLVPRDVSSVDVSLSTVPQLAPSQPTGLETSVSFKTINLLWDFDNTSETSYYSIFLNNELAVAHVPANTDNIVTSNGKWTKTFTDLVPGRQYIIDIVAEKLVGSTIYVSSQKSTVVAMPYDVPTQVQNLRYVPGDKTINLFWDAPSSSSGAGLSGNGNLKYRVEIVNPANGGLHSKIVDSVTTTSYIIGSSPMIDGSGNSFSLQNGQNYTVNVKAFFDIANTNSQAVSSKLERTVQPKRLPVLPVLTAVARDISGVGQAVTLKLALDVSCVSTDMELKFTRVIRDTSNVLLSTKFNNNVLINPTIINGVVEYIDKKTNSGISIVDDVDFLNGNMLTYTCEVRSKAWTTGYDDVQTTVPINVTPSGNAIIDSIAIDQSGNVTLLLNKNGSTFNSLNVIGIDALTQKVQVQDVTSSNVVFSNAKVNDNGNSVAQNQKATVYLPRSAWIAKVTKALGIFSTANSTATKAEPANSFA